MKECLHPKKLRLTRALRALYKSRSLQQPFYWNGRQHQDWVPPDAFLPRPELIHVLVPASIWDHHVVVEFIQMRMDDLTLRLGTTFSRDEIVNALGELIDLGYAKAWGACRDASFAIEASKRGAPS